MVTLNMLKILSSSLLFSVKVFFLLIILFREIFFSEQQNPISYLAIGMMIVGVTHFRNFLQDRYIKSICNVILIDFLN